jgi:hypothetical protein
LLKQGEINMSAAKYRLTRAARLEGYALLLAVALLCAGGTNVRSIPLASHGAKPTPTGQARLDRAPESDASGNALLLAGAVGMIGMIGIIFLQRRSGG